MKNLLVLALGLTSLLSLSTHAVLPSNDPALPDYDARGRSPAKARVASPEAVEAETRLRSRLPGVTVSRDRVTTTPRLITSRRGFLTPASPASSAIQKSRLAPELDVVSTFINENVALFGHDASILADSRRVRDHTTPHNGLRTTVWEQTQDGVPVFEGLFVAHVTARGELARVSDRFLPNLAQAASAQRTKLASGLGVSPTEALAQAAANAGGAADAAASSVVSAPQGAERKQVLRMPGLVGPAWVQLVWLPLNTSEVRLCWRAVFNVSPSAKRYLSLVDAETGEVLLRRSLNVSLTDNTYNVYTGDSPTPMTPGHATPLPDQPAEVERTLVTLSALNTNASPSGWIDDLGLTTSGNNAEAFLDRDMDFAPDMALPTGGNNHIFDFPVDLGGNPLGYAQGSVVQMFYRANWFHDRLYELGFTEDAGNYQVANFDRGGVENDPVICLTQAGASVGYSDNAMFQPGPDGVPGYVYMFVWSAPDPQRDGALDQQVVIHELTHGVSDRLLGAGVGISQLQSLGLGEGWSDFYSLALLGEETDDPDATYPVGSYAFRDGGGVAENYYFGIRRYPYSTDMSKNPLTLRDIDPRLASAHRGVPVNPAFGGGNPSEPHNSGEIWCMALWEVHAALVKKLGWEEGNLLSLQLVTDGLRLAPENATFTEARDAVLQADEILTGASNYDEIWIAFAKRGFGFSAVVPASDTTTGVSESFDLPPDLTAGPEDGILEVRITPGSGTVLFAGDPTSLFVKVSDLLPITNATVTATLNGNPVTFRNDGEAPDAFKEDNTYSGTMDIPVGVSNLVVEVVVTAPEKEGYTNTVSYYIIPPPPNDEFRAAVKVPAAGADFFTSNRRATLQDDEPQHAGLPGAAASLWYNYTSPSGGKVLVDTGGSDFTTVVAVYTNSTLATLKPVISGVGSMTASGRRGAFVNFDARPGVTYRIAIAGYNNRSTGNLRLWVGTGGIPDTNRPVATVTSPLSGVQVSTNRVLFAGAAVDSQPNPSGIRQIHVTITSGLNDEFSETMVIQPMPSFDGPVSTNWVTIVGLRSGVNHVAVSAVDFAGNKSAPVNVDVINRAMEPLNDFFAAAASLSATNGIANVNTLNATREVGEPNHAGFFGSKSAWWRFTAPADGVLTLSTTNSTFDTVMAVYTGAQISSLVPVGSNDDAYPEASGGFSLLAQPVRSGIVYHIAVDGYDNAGGALFLEHSFNTQAVFHVTTSCSEGGSVTPPSLDVQSNATLVVTATAAPNFQFEKWEGSMPSLDNPLSVLVNGNLNLVARFVPIPVSDGFESGSFGALPWKQGGAQPWIIDSGSPSAGSFAARSGAITHKQYTSLLLTTELREGTASFDYRVDSEPMWDRLAFYLDGSLVQQWSGNTAWANFTFPISGGTHTLEWRYSKDNLNTLGADAAFLDNVKLPLVQVIPPTPPTLKVARQADGRVSIELLGQAGKSYVIQSSTDLRQWNALFTGPAEGGSLRYTDPNLPTGSVRYYRAMVSQ